jgi:hypothetical protein
MLHNNLASTRAESNAAAADIVEHLERALLHVAEDSGVAILARGRESEAATVQNAGDVEVHDGAAGEGQRNLGHGDGAEAVEVEAGVQQVGRGRRGRVRLHLLPERCPQRAVRRRRQPRDDGAGVDDGACGEDRGWHVEPGPRNSDGLEEHAVERRGVPGPRHGRARIARGAASRAEGEEPGGARRAREAVGERLAVGRRRMRYEGLRVAAEPHEAVHLVDESGGAVAAPELEALDDVGRGQAQRVGAVRPLCGGAVAVRDEVLALRVQAAVALAAELRALRGAAGEGGVRGGLGRIEELVLLRVARSRGAGSALHPRHVAARVDDHDLGHGGRANADGDHVLRGAKREAGAGRDGHGRLLELLGAVSRDLGVDVGGTLLVQAEHFLQRRLLFGDGRRARAVAVGQWQRGTIFGWGNWDKST